MTIKVWKTKISKYKFSLNLAKEDDEKKILDVLAGINDQIREETNVGVVEEDWGIGPYECHGQRGTHHDYIPTVQCWDPESHIEMNVWHPHMSHEEARPIIESIILDAQQENNSILCSVVARGELGIVEPEIYTLPVLLIYTWEMESLGNNTEVRIKTAWEVA